MRPTTRFLLALLVLPLLGGCRGEPRFNGTTYEPIAPAPDFALTDQAGRTVTRATFAGSPTLLFFGYTRCPDLCPTTLSRLRRAAHDLPATRIVLITVDPAHDTPAVLAEYVRRFGDGVVGLTGDSASLATAMQGYGAYAMPAAPHAGHGAAAPAATLGHSSVVYGLDREGNLRVVIPEGAAEADLAEDVRTLSRL